MSRVGMLGVHRNIRLGHNLPKVCVPAGHISG